MHAHRFGIMNFEETIVGKLTEVYQTVHLKEFTDFPKKDEKDPTKVLQIFISRRNLLLMKPITCHMDFASESIELIHPLIEGHLVDARAQGE